MIYIHFVMDLIVAEMGLLCVGNGVRWRIHCMDVGMDLIVIEMVSLCVMGSCPASVTL